MACSAKPTPTLNRRAFARLLPRMRARKIDLAQTFLTQRLLYFQHERGFFPKIRHFIVFIFPKARLGRSWEDHKNRPAHYMPRPPERPSGHASGGPGHWGGGRRCPTAQFLV